MALSLSPASRDTLKNLLICASLGNLFCSRQWYQLSFQAREYDYYRDAPLNPTLLAAIFISILVLASVFAAGWYWVRTNPSGWRLRLGETVFLLAAIYPMESVRRYWNASRFDLGANIVLAIIETTLAVGCFLALAGNDHIVRVAKRAVFSVSILIPIFLIDFGSPFLAVDRASFETRPSAKPLAPPRPRRVLWILFDELDQRIAFDRRPASVRLPELDRLLAASFSASEARQTQSATLLAIPSLFSSRLVASAETIDARTLHIGEAGGKQDVNWREQPNIFTRARAIGANSAIAGWYHPYCRIFGDQLVDCFSVGANGLLPDMVVSKQTVARTVEYILRSVIRVAGEMFVSGDDSQALKFRTDAVQRLQQKEYFMIHKRALADAADPRLNLIFVHYPIPHPLGIYDRQRRDFSISGSIGYLDNLELVDRSLGELRKKVESAGLAELTTILITGDHGLRPREWRNLPGWNQELRDLTAAGASPLVPFIVNFPGSAGRAAYDRPFSTAVTGDLALAILAGNVSNPAEAAAWLDDHVTENGRAMR